MSAPRRKHWIISMSMQLFELRSTDSSSMSPARSAVRRRHSGRGRSPPLRRRLGSTSSCQGWGRGPGGARQTPAPPPAPAAPQQEQEALGTQLEKHWRQHLLLLMTKIGPNEYHLNGIPLEGWQWSGGKYSKLYSSCCKHLVDTEPRVDIQSLTSSMPQ